MNMDLLCSLMTGKEWGSPDDLRKKFTNGEATIEAIGKGEPKDYYFNGQELIIHYEDCGYSCCVTQWAYKWIITHVYGNDGLIVEYSVDYDAPFAISFEDFQKEINFRLNGELTSGNTKTTEYTATADNYFAKYEPMKPERTAADMIIIYQTTDRKCAIMGNLNTTIPTMKKYDDFSELLSDLEKMQEV